MTLKPSFLGMVREKLAASVVTIIFMLVTAVGTMWLQVRDLRAESAVTQRQQAVQDTRTSLLERDHLEDTRKLSELNGKMDVLIEEIRQLREDIRVRGY
jgi:hypothetical protein